MSPKHAAFRTSGLMRIVSWQICVFVIDRDGILRYQGAVDDVMFRQKIPTRFYLDEAIEALLARDLPEIQETSAYGCAIVREI
jgi:hypothetical protein